MAMFKVSWLLLLCSILSASLLNVCGTKYTYKYNYVGFSSSTVPKKMIPKTSLTNGDQFGAAVAVWNNKAIISSSRLVAMTDGSVNTGGVVFLFYQNSKTRQWYDSGKKFVTPYGLDGYGKSIALWSTTIAVGAPLLGHVHVYSGTNFQTETELTAGHYEENDYFGHSVAVIHGAGHYSASGAIVVGAYGHSQNPEHQHTGSVFVFALDDIGEWKQAALLQPSHLTQNGFFGYSVSAYGNTVAVGAPGAESAFVFSMEGHIRECPHEGHMPEGCEHEHHHRQLRQSQSKSEGQSEGQGRSLQEGHEGEREGQEDREREEHEKEERERQERQHTFYTEWEYKEELEVVAAQGEELGFGTTVSVYNKTDSSTGDMVISVAIGAVYDYQTSSSSATGSVYIISQMQEGDVISSWHPTDYFPEHEHDQPHRSLQEGHDAHEEEKHNQQRYWPIKLVGYTSDKLDRFWMLETTLYGTTPGEKFGHAIAIEYASVVVGNHPEALGVGRASIYSRIANTGEANVNIPLYQGPLYKTMWKLSTTLNDAFGGTNDMFGGAVSLYGKTVLVGSYLTGFHASSSASSAVGTIGTGASYVYDSVKVTATKVAEEVEEVVEVDEVVAADPVVDDSLTGLMKSLTVVSFSFIVAVFSTICGVVAYKFTQRKINDGTFDPLYTALGRVRDDAGGGGIKSLSDIDSSTNSEHSMLGSNSQSSMSSSSTSTSTSSYGSYSRPPPPRAGGAGAGAGGQGGTPFSQGAGGGGGGYQPRQPSMGQGLGQGQFRQGPGQQQQQQGAGRQMGGAGGRGAGAGGGRGVGRSGYASRPGSSGGGMSSGMSNISGL